MVHLTFISDPQQPDTKPMIKTLAVDPQIGHTIHYWSVHFRLGCDLDNRFEHILRYGVQQEYELLKK